VRQIYVKFPKVAPGLVLVAIVTVMQLATRLDPHEVYRVVSEVAGVEVLGKLFTLSGILLGACPLFGTFLALNVTTVCLHSNTLSEEMRLMDKMDGSTQRSGVANAPWVRSSVETSYLGKWQYAKETIERDQCQSKVVEYFCRQHADYVITNIGWKDPHGGAWNGFQRTRDWDLEQDAVRLLKMTHVQQPVLRLLLLGLFIVGATLQLQQLSALW